MLTSVSGLQLGFCQNRLGHLWAQEKFKRLKKSYGDWLQSGDDNFESRQRFILEVSKNNPALAIRDIEGRYRLIDDHHGFCATYLFLKEFHQDFQIHIFTQMDFFADKKWTAEKMMDSLSNKKKVFIWGVENPSYSDLKSIPSQIDQIEDAPERTLISRVLESFEIPLRGFDFVPFIQFLVKQKMDELSFSMDFEAVRDQGKLKGLTEEFLQSKELLMFLLENLDNKTDSSRQIQVRNFLQQKINSL